MQILPVLCWPHLALARDGRGIAACWVPSAGSGDGRYRIPKVPLGERVCKLCNNGKVETEFHFVMECNKLQTLRNEMFLII